MQFQAEPLRQLLQLQPQQYLVHLLQYLQPPQDKQLQRFRLQHLQVMVAVQ
jgi:hypothetical protein